MLHISLRFGAEFQSLTRIDDLLPLLDLIRSHDHEIVLRVPVLQITLHSVMLLWQVAII